MSNNPRSRLAADDRREQILRVAAAHFSRDGYEQASVQRIATEAGVTRALVYHYFPGKASMLEAVLRGEAEALLAETAPVPGRLPSEGLREALGVYLDHFAQSGGAVRELYAPTAASAPLVREIIQATHAVQAERMMRQLALDATPRMRLAVRAWLMFIVELAREHAAHADVTRAEVIELCVRTFEAATGVELARLPPHRDFEDP